MESIEEVDPETIVAGTGDWLTPETVDVLADHPLDCVETAFPHVAWSVESPEETLRPEEDHPIFYGCFDWHSAVHGHWSLVRQLRLVGDHPREPEIVESLDARFTDANVEAEVAYLEENRSFEKPYGWAWFLRLAAELALWEGDPADRWREALRPLEAQVVDLVETEFLTGGRPFRVGTHDNSAFALACVLDYARVTSNASLEAATADTSRSFFLEDRDAPVEYEPLGWDFLSPSRSELDLMRRVLGPGAFAEWVDAFLPDVRRAPYDSILRPVQVDADPEEGIALHLVGLNLSKAWCLAGIASSLPDHPYAEAVERAARRHVEDSIEQAFTEEYAGSHWLSTFVLYLVTRNAGGIAPDPVQFP